MPDSPDNSIVPPPLPNAAAPTPAPGRNFLTLLLSLCLWLFLIDCIISLADDSLKLFFGLHFLGLLRVLVAVTGTLVAIIVYVLMGFVPMIPKRVFLPLALFDIAAPLSGFLLMIYFYQQMLAVAWITSFCQVVIGIALIYQLGDGFNFRWRLVTEKQLGAKPFNWKNLVAFVLANVFVLLPVILVYFGVCAALAVNHFSEGFVSLRPSGISMQERTYVRNDGKKIRLYPMSHVADELFFDEVSQSFPTNSIVLLEGVSDEHELLTNKISYKRMATSLGLGEQHEDFKPTHGEMVRADIDIDQFTTNTIELLNLVMLAHSKGVSDPGTLMKLSQYTPPPDFPKRLFDDLLGLRNKHLLAEIQSHLAESNDIVVPWGAAHMPGLAEGIQKLGFRLQESHNYLAIPFHSTGKDRTVKH